MKTERPVLTWKPAATSGHVVPPAIVQVSLKAKNTYNLPEGTAIQRVLVKFFQDQRAAIVAWMNREHQKFLPFALPRTVLVECKLFPPKKFPSFDSLGLGNKELAKRVRPHIATIWEDTGIKMMAKLRAARVKHKMHRKDLSTAFDVTNQNIAWAIDTASFRFAKSTNDSTSLELDDAIDQLRESMIEGMEEGDTLSALTDRVKEVFDGAEDYRAARIANTESSRAYHEAQGMAAEESGVVTGFQWLASDAACEQICLPIVDQAEYMKMGEPFAVVDDDPDYGTIFFPPAHPNCMCTCVEVLDTDDQPQWGETYVAPPPSGKGKKSLDSECRHA